MQFSKPISSKLPIKPGTMRGESGTMASQSPTVPPPSARLHREPEREESTAVRRYGAAMAIEFENADALPSAIANAAASDDRDQAIAAIAVGMQAPLSSLMLTSVLLLQHTNTDRGAAHLRRYIESLQRSADQLEMGIRALVERATPDARVDLSARVTRSATDTPGPASVKARPSSRAPTSAGGQPRLSSVAPPHNRAPRQRVLVVDDDVEILAGMRDALERNGFEVVTASNGPSALAASEKTALDLIILDLCLPDMDGEQICREFRRQRGRSAPIVMVSASPRLEETCHALGVEHYLRKPFEVNDLVATLSRATLAQAAAAANGSQPQRLSK